MKNFFFFFFFFFFFNTSNKSELTVLGQLYPIMGNCHQSCYRQSIYTIIL